MKKQKKQFNDMLLRYNRYLRKLGRLELTGRNKHRQSVLNRHIERLNEKLTGLYISIKGSIAVAAISGMCMMTTPEATAQTTFGDVQENPFELSNVVKRSTPVFVDLDDDGDLDIMTGSNQGTFFYFQNTGTDIAPSFDTKVSSPFNLSNIGSASALSFTDLDNDGDLDMMAGSYYGSFHYFENTGTHTTPSFAAAQQNLFGLMGIGSRSTISFVDMDNDGDFDLMAGENAGSFHYFENTGSDSAPAFAIAQLNPFNLTNNGLYSTQTFADLDKDGDLDLLRGGRLGNLSYFENTGTITNPAFGIVQVNPFQLEDIGNSSTPYFADIDNDGDMDVLAGEYDGDFFFFENTTPVGTFFEALEFNPFSLTNVIKKSNPHFVDLDNDGDLDIMTGSNQSTFYYFQNTGTSTAPAYAAKQTNPFNLTNIGSNSTLTFTDLDNDGDLDMMTGSYYGSFHYFENSGTNMAPAFEPAQQNLFGLTNIGNRSFPEFVDLDNDGIMDLMAGEDAGSFHYFPNTGTNVAPAFGAVQLNPFSLSDIGRYSAPSFADLDRDGDLDMISGNQAGRFSYFENTGTKSVPDFAVRQVNPFELSDIGSSSSPSFVDLDNDGDIDILSGDYSGDFYYFENNLPSPLITWDGDTDSDWNTASNWDGDVVPIISDDVLIPNVVIDPIVTTDIKIDNIEIEASASLTISTKSLTVNGDLTLNGSMIVNSGTSLIPLGTSTGIGSATIHRSTTFGIADGQYSVIGSPIMTGNTNDLGDIVYSYDETIAYEPGIGNSNGGNRFVIATSEAMSIGDAYFSANTGDISFTGLPNSGDIDIPLVYNLGQDGAGAGFNLVSNPYPAAILYNNFVANNADIDGTIYLWDDGGSDMGTRDNSDYITANSMGVASGGSGRAASWDGYIRSVQGFFVKATTAGTLSFTPSMMDDGNNSKAGFFRTEKPRVLKFSLASDIHFNEILIGFTDKATLGFDRTLDAHKAKGNNNLQFYSRMNDATLAIQALPNIIEETIVDLGFDVADAGTYTFELKDAAQYGFGVYLKDHELGKLIDLSVQSAYIFNTESVQNSNRFSLVFSPNAVLAIEDKLISNDIIVFSNTAGLNVRMSQKLKNATVRIYNLSGTLVKEVSQVDFAGADWTTRFNQQGLFIMTVQTEGQLFVKKFFK